VLVDSSHARLSWKTSRKMFTHYLNVMGKKVNHLVWFWSVQPRTYIYIRIGITKERNKTREREKVMDEREHDQIWASVGELCRCYCERCSNWQSKRRRKKKEKKIPVVESNPLSSDKKRRRGRLNAVDTLVYIHTQTYGRYGAYNVTINHWFGFL
jgi:hypothetical protein